MNHTLGSLPVTRADCKPVGSRTVDAMAVLTGAMFTMAPTTAEGAVMLAPGTTLPGNAYISHGTQFANSMVAVKTVSPTSGTIRYASGVQINPYTIVTAAHVLDSAVGFRPFANVFVLGGTNFNSPDFEASILSYNIHPTYIQGSGLATGTQIDLAVITLSSPIIGRGVDFGSSISNNTAINLTGYGVPALSAFSPVAQDGYLRGFQGYSTNPSSQFSDLYYGTASASGSLPGEGSQYDSGGGVFYNDKLLGIMTSVSVGTERTTYLDLTNSEIQSYISSVSVPEPTTTAAVGIALLALSALRKRET